MRGAGLDHRKEKGSHIQYSQEWRKDQKSAGALIHAPLHRIAKLDQLFPLYPACACESCASQAELAGALIHAPLQGASL